MESSRLPGGRTGASQVGSYSAARVVALGQRPGGVGSSPSRPGSGVVGQAVRFAITGGLVALLYVVTTAALSELFGVPFQIALAIGFSGAVLVHFSLQRLFVWVHADGFALPIRRQVVRYLAVAGVQYGATAASTATLPRLLDVHVTYVYLATAFALTVLNFLVFRAGVFHPGQPLERPVADT